MKSMDVNMTPSLAALLPRSAIILELAARTKEAVIQELVKPLVADGVVTNEADFIAAILRRENLESTGIGLGVAIPHARTNAAKSITLAFGRSDSGVDFASLDGKPSHIIFLIAAPENNKREYISVLARLSSLLRREEVRIGLNRARTADEVYAVLEQHDRPK
ncbi:MAG: PTS sugar transporter subunit IIA [candidate division WOR-3 bacterium]